MKKTRMLIAVLVLALFASACAGSRANRSRRYGLFDQPDLKPHARQRHSSGAFAVVPAEKVRHYRLLKLDWPLDQVSVTSAFGFRNGDRHEGIDLRAPVGTPVYAAHSGSVLYSGSGISGYGNLVILRHASGLSTVYAHHSKNLVKKGMHVRRGQKIALSGNTGRSSGPHLHFEVRDGSDPFDPNLVLPPADTWAPHSRTRLAARDSRVEPKRLAVRDEWAHDASARKPLSHRERAVAALKRAREGWRTQSEPIKQHAQRFIAAVNSKKKPKKPPRGVAQSASKAKRLSTVAAHAAVSSRAAPTNAASRGGKRVAHGASPARKRSTAL